MRKRLTLNTGIADVLTPTQLSSSQDLFFESSYKSLCKVTEELESALSEAKNSRMRRIIKLLQ